MQTSTSSANRSSIVRYLSVTGLSLWALVMALAPDPGFNAPWYWISLFWAMQIAVGLTVLQTTLYLLSRADSQGRMPLWSLVVMSGFCGAAVLTPIYWLIGEGLMQQVLGFAETFDADELVSVQQTFGWAVLVDEWLDISAPVIAAWALISWPRLQGLLPPLVQSLKKSVDEPLASLSQVSSVVEESVQNWRKALPTELGNDVVAVKSELQYLRVWTTRGSALVLGSLQEVEDAEGSAGMRVHRSWWVHARHVRTIRRSGEAVICELSDGREVPVSRRRKADAVARFGDRARYEDLPAASRDARSPTLTDQNARRNPT
jgi:hypothetical protein